MKGIDQHRLSVGPLLDEKGNLTEKGYATKLVKEYNRSSISTSAFRIKEWDYYLISSDCYALALTISDNGYMGMDSISLIELDRNRQTTTSKIVPFTLGRRHLPKTSEVGDICVRGKGYEMNFENDGKKRRLFGHMNAFRDGKDLIFDVTLFDPPKDSMVIATPFDKPGHFYYNQKINCIRAEGKVCLGEDCFLFAPAHSYAVLDWGRGVWTYRNTWYWGSCSSIHQGKRFGFNIGYGFGNTSAATENMLFYDGKAHKLSRITFNIPMKDGKEDYLSPWTFTSDDGRFEMNFIPVLDRAAKMDFLLLGSDQHQVFGRFSGKAVLDDGSVLEVKDLPGFAEKVYNKW